MFSALRKHAKRYMQKHLKEKVSPITKDALQFIAGWLGWGYQMTGADLRGFVRDVFDVGAVFVEYCGLGAAGIRLLVNNRATK